MSRAKMRGVDVMSLTDHDTIAGLSAARQAADEQGIGFVDGIELSTHWGRFGIHVVGLGFDPANAALNNSLKTLSEARLARAEAIALQLAKLGFPQALVGAKTFAGDADIGRLHFARYLVSIGAVKNVQAAFKKYLGAGKAADVKHQWPEIGQAVELINGAGGIAVLAHPLKYDFTRTKMRTLIQEFAALGGKAVEVISGYQPINTTLDLAKIVVGNHLLGSCGSDFHVPDQPWQDLGGFGSLPEQVTPVWQQLGYIS